MTDNVDPLRALIDTLVEDTIVGLVDTLDVPQVALFLVHDPWDPSKLGGWYSASRGTAGPALARHPDAPPPLMDIFREAEEANGLRYSRYMPSWLHGLRAALIFPLRSTASDALIGLLYLGYDPKRRRPATARQVGSRMAERVGRALERAEQMRAAKDSRAQPEA